MLRKLRKLAIVPAVMVLWSCAQNKEYAMGTYGYDVDFLDKNNIGTLELINDEGARVLISADYQGRVMTSSSDGMDGGSYGWINYKLIESGEVSPQFNPIGGEERFWLGPEGGKFSLYFKPGDEQIHPNWLVPKVIDTEAYDVVLANNTKAVFAKDAVITNASGTVLNIGINRAISLLDRSEIGLCLGVEVPEGVKCVAYQTNNQLTNIGSQAWTKETGLPSVWLLGLFNPTPTTTVFIPYNEDVEGKIMNDEYFGKVPADRLIADNGTIYFKIDGKHRSKIGVPAGRSRDVCGSYDSEKNVLTIVKFVLPQGEADYVNGQWGEQDDPFNGDVINSYNDGPLEDGSIMGPFYEIESSSPGAALAPGESLNHVQSTIHIQGPREQIAIMVKSLFGLELDTITSKFQ